MSVVSKKVWQNRYAGQRIQQSKLLTDIEYITESTDKAMLERMKDLAQE